MERAQSLHQEQQVDRQGQRVEERVRLHPFRHLLGSSHCATCCIPVLFHLKH